AGSNTISTFAVDPRDPTKLQPIGKPVSSGGEFPVSVAVSKKRGLVCVLNAGRINGVNCFKPSNTKGLVPAPNTQRSMNLTQTTPPAAGPGPNGLGHVIFNEAETQLIVSARQIGPSEVGLLAVWDINPAGGLSQNWGQIVGGVAPLGLAILPGKNAVIATDPALGYEIYDLNALSGRQNKTGVFPVPGQGSLCWSVYNPKSGNVYLADALGANVLEVSVNANLGSTIVNKYNLSPGSQALDSELATIAGKQYLYVLAANTQAINVLALQAPGNATILQAQPFGPAATSLGVSQGKKHEP
ncbi:hypothetical protein M422DRAFT_157271, partial [Sphaerobolus stellatus SS14]